MRMSQCHPDKTHYGRGLCKACYEKANSHKRREYQKAWVGRNKEKVRLSQKQWNERNGRAAHLKRHYGLREEDVIRIVAQQGGLCPICLKPEPDVVDHCHKTGRVRGILHRRCNSALGTFGDCVDGLERAIGYLRSSEQSFPA